MNNKIFWLSFFAVLVGTMADNAELQVLKGNGLFTNKLYKLLSQNEGNVFFSPISAHTVLSMAYQGSAGSTEKAFQDSLSLPSIPETAQGYSQVVSRLNNVPNVTLLTANKVFLAEGSKLKENFKNVVANQFQSEVQQVNFGESVAAAKTINDWVLEKTNNKIKDLITPDSLDALTRLVLVNAIYFKGDWANKFKKEDTRTEPFYLNDKDTIEVQMMHLHKKFNYKHDDQLKAKVIELPYNNHDVSMVVILPDERDGIKELEAKLENVDLTKITDGTWNAEVELALPKFKIETTIPLNENLKQIGLGEIFDSQKANFTNLIEGDEKLYVSKVIQKAFIEVNEEGAEAAAATGAVVKTRVGHIASYFLADHPFVILMAHKQAEIKNPLFYGKIFKPEYDGEKAPKGEPVKEHSFVLVSSPDLPILENN